MKNIWILAVLLLCFACSQQENSITGEWVWGKNSKEATFSVTIQKEGNSYVGRYCAVALSGAKIDCNVEDIPVLNFPSFKIENVQGNEFVADFKTYFSEATGKVKIRIKGNIMYWEIIEEPKGEYYCPNVAILKRSRK